MLDARSSFYACLCTETKSRSTNSQRKERGQYPAILTEQTWSLKDLLYGFRGKFFLRDIAGSPERARWLHLASSGGQSQRAIWVILPARGASHIISQVTGTGKGCRVNETILTHPRFNSTCLKSQSENFSRHALHTAAEPAAHALVKTQLSYRNDTI